MLTNETELNNKLQELSKSGKTTYYCGITNNQSQQKSHHEKHLKSKTYKQQEKIFRLEIEKLTPEELKTKFKGEENIDKIIEMCKTIIIKPKKTNNNQQSNNKQSNNQQSNNKQSNNQQSNNQQSNNQQSNNQQELILKRKTNLLIYENPENIINESQNTESFKYKFLDFLGKMHNLLRGASVTGDQALDDILHTLCLCYLEDKISEKGLFDLVNSEKSCYKGIIQRKVKDYSKYLKVSYLIEHPEELCIKDSTTSIEKCGKLLSKHPITSHIFRDNENFINCQDTQILCQLLNQCQDFSKNQNIFEEVDVTGIAYEYMTTKHAGNGGASKEMGQYFTERPLMIMCFKLIDKCDIVELGIDDNSTLGDEFCATLGFPLMAREFLKEEFEINIKDKNIYGVEWHERLSKFAYMNAMFSMNNFKNVIRGNSFITNVNPHLDISVHNVPFGKSMIPKMIEKTYNAFLTENTDKDYPKFQNYIPFNTKKIDAILSSQVVLYKTKKMGLMIIKDGEETSGKSNDKYRKWFSENCIIKKIMKIPSGAFTCTDTKTVCIYFIKKEGQMTENIQFLQLSDDGNKITEICKVSMADMKQNHYSWDPNGYIIDEEMEKMMSKSKCEWKKLDKCIKKLYGINKNSSLGKEEGKYPLYYCSILGNLYLDTFDYERTGIIMNKTNGSGKSKVYLGKDKYNVGKTTLHFESFDITKILTEYIYYFIKFNIKIFEKYYKGSNQKSICYDDFNNINMPIPPIEIQNQVVEILDDLAKQTQLLADRKSGIERQMKYYLETQIKKMVNDDMCEWNKLADILKISGNGKTNSSDITNIGSIPFYKASVNNPSGITTNYDFDNINGNDYLLFVKSGGSAKKPISLNYGIGKVFLVNGKSAANIAVFQLINTSNNLTKYLYYYLLLSQEKIQKLAKYACNNGNIDMDNFKLFNIPISSIETQNKVVQYLDKLEEKKNSINEEISEIDSLMKQVLEQSYN